MKVKTLKKIKFYHRNGTKKKTVIKSFMIEKRKKKLM